jgi:O-antigen ligase
MNSFLDPEYAHNDFIQAWAEYGLVGLLLLIAGAMVVVVRMVRQVRRTESDRTATLIIAFLGALVAMSAHACFDYNFHIYGNASVLVMMAGLGRRVPGAGRRLAPVRVRAVAAALVRPDRRCARRGGPIGDGAGHHRLWTFP